MNSRVVIAMVALGSMLGGIAIAPLAPRCRYFSPPAKTPEPIRRAQVHRVRHSRPAVANHLAGALGKLAEGVKRLFNARSERQLVTQATR
ncbi:hypothetical protein [Mesorhizobium sp. BHbdii]